MNFIQFSQRFALIAFVATLDGCNQDSLSDAVTRQKDREREGAQVLAQEYSNLAGKYHGDVRANDTDYDIKAVFANGVISREANLVPQPTITGSFTLEDLTHKDAAANTTKTVFSFANGSYDSASQKLAITILGVQGSPAILVSCNVQSSDRMSCSWNSLISDLVFSFDLSRT